MNARTLIITAGALVALAAPAVASARLSPAEQYQKNLAAKKHAAKHAKQVFVRQGRSRQIYWYYPAPAFQGEKSLAELQAEYNADLIAHTLDPVEFPAATTAAPASDDSSSTTGSDSSSTTPDSSTTTSDSSSATPDSTPTSDASFAAATATPLVDSSDDC
jgi:hypothetical protein